MLSETVIGHVLRRLKSLGVDAVFGVPGDFSFDVQDAILAEPGMDWIGCCNELNAGYAADGYARVRGFGALSTTYGVGELSAINAVAGSYADNVPIVHLTGMPAIPVQNAGSLVHHTLGDGRFELFRQMADVVACASAVMTPHNVVSETERLLAAAINERRPVYMAFPAELARLPAVTSVVPAGAPRKSNARNLRSACDAIEAAIGAAESACVLPGILVSRLGLTDRLAEFIDRSQLPFATMFADKAVLDERHPGYIGMYHGALMGEHVREFVEGCDQVLLIGTSMTDLNSGLFTARLDRSRTIDIGHHRTRIGDHVFRDVEIADVLAGLALRRDGKVNVPSPRPTSLPTPTQPQDGAITADVLYSRWERFFDPGDTIVAETGTVSLGLAFAHLPSGARFLNQTLWGSIGWATPAALGAAVAEPGRRVILLTGEGSHQVSVQELSQFARRGLTPIVFVLNNGGYLIERLLCRDPSSAYNDVATWRYADLPHAFGCTDWFTARVTTCGELDSAMQVAASCGTGAYIEVMTDPYAAPPAARRLRERIDAANESD